MFKVVEKKTPVITLEEVYEGFKQCKCVAAFLGANGVDISFMASDCGVNSFTARESKYYFTDFEGRTHSLRIGWDAFARVLEDYSRNGQFVVFSSSEELLKYASDTGRKFRA